MIPILGASRVIANEVVKLLSARKHPFRLAARNARPVRSATEMISADLSDNDQTVCGIESVSGDCPRGHSGTVPSRILPEREFGPSCRHIFRRPIRT
jgi:hypothetical protein